MPCGRSWRQGSQTEHGKSTGRGIRVSAETAEMAETLSIVDGNAKWKVGGRCLAEHGRCTGRVLDTAISDICIMYGGRW